MKYTIDAINSFSGEWRLTWLFMRYTFEVVGKYVCVVQSVLGVG